MTPEPLKPRSFRLPERDIDRLNRLAGELDCNQSEVLSRALVALRIAVDAGWDFDWVFGPGLVLKHEAGETTWFQIQEDDSLQMIGAQPAKPTKDGAK